MWNIEKAEHCHMFHSILATNPPWYVGHLYLPNGDSLGNGNGVVGGNGGGSGGGNGYGDALGGPSNANENVPSFIDASQSYMQIQNHLNKINNNGISKNDSNNNANKNPTPPLIGTLLRITDRRLQDTDGKMILAVQAIDKFRVENIVSTSPYLVTNVEIWPEEEMVNEYFDRALLTSASSVSGSGTTSGDNAVVNDDTMDIAGDYDDNNSEDASLLSNNPLVVTGAARAAAVADSNRCRKFEYLPFFLEEKVRRPPSANTLQKSTASLEEEEKRKKKEDIGAEYSNVVQLSNYDALSFNSLEDSSSVTSQALKVYWTNLREMQESANDDTSSTADATTYYDDPLFHSNAMTSETSSPLPTPLAFTPSSSSPSTKSSLTPYYSIESIEMLEYHLWRTVDEMIRLLSKASSSAVPLPTQLLGLLPKRKDWPREFILEDYANSLSLAGGTIGTFAQSSFVRVDQVTSRNNNSTDTTATSSVASQSSSPSYSNLRRAQRMSYAIWLLLDGLAMTGAQPAPPSRDLILGMNSIGERLDAAKRTLDGINGILRKMIPENRN